MENSTSEAWRYERAQGADVEVAIWQGASAPATSAHFHRQTQVTFVLSGCRRFLVGQEILTVSSGHCLVIREGVPHRGLTDPHPGTECINLYLDREAHSAAPLGIHAEILAAADVSDSIAVIAGRAGLSRESFTRCFSQNMGMPPQAYRLMNRLNEARQRLRQGAQLAELALDLGFADQSHFGRHFRRAFGVSPAEYRAATRASQTF